MPWNPNVPNVINRVQDDLDAIRENFQHLDQLAERVDELQTVSELAPIANDLQAVSGLAPVANELHVVSELAPIANDLQAVSALAPVVEELQAVSGLAPVAGELQAVSELAPYVQAILDSHIVEMGSNANGEYVRWENGLQICMVQRLLMPGFFNTSHMFGDWTFPAAFAAADYVPIGFYDFDDDDAYPHFVKSLMARNKTTTSVRIDLYSNNMFTSSDIRYVSVLVVGRWK